MRPVSNIKIYRQWSMPSKSTFTLAPIRELLERLRVGNGWADPYAGESKLAEFRNDINGKHDSSLDAVEFLRSFEDESIDGLLVDPPYSARQITEVYDGLGKIKPLTAVYKQAVRIIKPNGYLVSFGWNSGGGGRSRGFMKEEILLVPHGGNHNDTIVTVERKICDQLASSASGKI